MELLQSLETGLESSQENSDELHEMGIKLLKVIDMTQSAQCSIVGPVYKLAMKFR